MSDLCPVAVSRGSDEHEEQVSSGDDEEQAISDDDEEQVMSNEQAQNDRFWRAFVSDVLQSQTLAKANLGFFHEKKYCDVTFTFPNLPDRIEAHELFLMVRSSVFENLFQMRKSENVHGNEIEITDSTPQRFQEFLKFIYADIFEADFAGALDLLHLAQKYEIHPLIKKCEDLLRTEIKVEESVQVFETARRYGRKDLVDQAGDIMVKSLADLIESGALANAQEETVMFLLQRDDLTVREAKLFEFILKWGEDQVTDSDGDNLLKDKLKNVIPLIRYTNMAPHEFKSLVVPTGLLSGEDMLSVYSYLAEDEAKRKDVQVKFNTVPRSPEYKAFIDFYTGDEDDVPCSKSTGCKPLKLCMSFEVRAWKKLWSDSVLKKPVVTAIRVKWPSREIENSKTWDRKLNFNIYIKEYFESVNDKNVRLRFKNSMLDCKEEDEAEIPVEPPVELISGLTYFIGFEDQANHHNYPTYHSTVNYTYSGVFSPYDLNPEAVVDLGGVDLKLTGIQKDSRLPGFSSSTAEFPVNVIRGIKIALV